VSRLGRCRGCGKEFVIGSREWRDHKPTCYPCKTCGHGFPERVKGCACCEGQP